MPTYTLSPKQLDKLKIQLHGKQTESAIVKNQSFVLFSTRKDLQKVLLFSGLILIGQIILQKIL